MVSGESVMCMAGMKQTWLEPKRSSRIPWLVKRGYSDILIPVPEFRILVAHHQQRAISNVCGVFVKFQ